ncbi:hypothetical protein JXB01_02570, partial [Candidatus Micrarchaeota archaeon]|nr:hypothetical protein [Candidatus Micrarchaeota archaeon]
MISDRERLAKSRIVKHKLRGNITSIIIEEANKGITETDAYDFCDDLIAKAKRRVRNANKKSDKYEIDKTEFEGILRDATTDLGDELDYTTVYRAAKTVSILLNGELKNTGYFNSEQMVSELILDTSNSKKVQKYMDENGLTRHISEKFGEQNPYVELNRRIWNEISEKGTYLKTDIAESCKKIASGKDEKEVYVLFSKILRTARGKATADNPSRKNEYLSASGEILNSFKGSEEAFTEKVKQMYTIVTVIKTISEEILVDLDNKIEINTVGLKELIIENDEISNKLRHLHKGNAGEFAEMLEKEGMLYTLVTEIESI